MLGLEGLQAAVRVALGDGAGGELVPADLLQRVEHRRGRGVALRGLPAQAAIDDGGEVRVHAGGGLGQGARVPAAHHLGQLAPGHVPEGALAGDELVEHDAQRVHVAARREVLAGPRLRGHVIGRAHQCAARERGEEHAIQRAGAEAGAGLRVELRGQLGGVAGRLGPLPGSVAEESSSLARPKSSSFTSPLSVSTTLPGLMSRWSTPRRWAALRPRARSLPMERARSPGTGLASRSRLTPRMNSEMRYGCSSSWPTR